MLPWNNSNTKEKMDGCNWCHQIAEFLCIYIYIYIHAWNQGSFIISNCDMSLLQFLFCKNTVNLKECVTFALLFYDRLNRRLQLELQTQYLWKKEGLQVLVSKKLNTFVNTRSLQKAFWKMMISLKCMVASTPIK